MMTARRSGGGGGGGGEEEEEEEEEEGVGGVCLSTLGVGFFYSAYFQCEIEWIVFLCYRRISFPFLGIFLVLC